MSIGDAVPSSSRQLFGGAITVDLPRALIDASDLRQIPDNQEVFLSDNSDTSIVVEILGMVEDGAAGTDLWDAAKFHFDSIAHDNSSLTSTILTPPPTSPIPSQPLSAPSTPTPITIKGTQVIHKFSHDPSGAPRPGHEGDVPDTVWVGVAIWRCWLGPTGLGSGSVSGLGRKKADVVLSVNVNLSADGGEAERGRAEGAFERAVESLKIKDWGLFGDEE